MGCILKVLDITNGQIKKVDVEDKAWMAWFDRMFVGVILMPYEVQELLDKVKDEGAICLAIERGVVKEPVKAYENPDGGYVTEGLVHPIVQARREERMAMLKALADQCNRCEVEEVYGKYKRDETLCEDYEKK